MYKAGKHNAADAFNKQPDYANEIEENSCLSTLQNKLKVIKTVISKSSEFSKKKLNKINHIKCVNDVSALMRCKLTIRDKFKLDWHNNPQIRSSMRQIIQST